MPFAKKTIKFLAYTLLSLALLLVLFSAYVWKVSDIKPPAESDTSALSLQTKHIDGGLYTIGDNWVRKSRNGLYELYVSGKPFERGVKNGKLTQPLITYQKAAFTEQIKSMIPSARYLRFLKYMVGFMNRNLASHVTNEYKEEIHGISYAASDSFSWIGSNYDRILNYHSAHDVGHALQSMMLVGCTSFGAWGGKTADGSMLLGRNFDFWVGDKFAENKIVAFYAPDNGHKFAFITWGGFIGVVSGMNDKGLTVTINAARSDIPWAGAATPVSLVAREILQYAGTIQQAVAIAKSRKMFVSESFLIGSAADHRAVVIEKTPDALAVYDTRQDSILCTNHYQSDELKDDKLNKEQLAGSASLARYHRLQELIVQNYPLTPVKIAAILRDRKGLHGNNIGNGNEQALNQMIAHHSIIFQPDSMRMWVSTQPWQLGEYICYDLRKIFAMRGLQLDVEIADNTLNIAEDTFMQSNDYQQFVIYKKYKAALVAKQPVDTLQVIKSNPYFYDAYRVAGDYCSNKMWYNAAIAYYVDALKLIVPTQKEKEMLQKKIITCQKKMNER